MPPAAVATIPSDVMEFYSALGQYNNRLEGLLLSDYGLYVNNDNVRLAEEVEDGHTDAKYKRVQVGITVLDEVPTLYLAICRQCNDVIHRDNRSFQLHTELQEYYDNEIFCSFMNKIS